MKGQLKKKNRFMAFLSSLCSAKPNADQDLTKDRKKCKLKVNKVPRLTFQLDRVLVKLSRKNIAEQEFMENEVLTFHLEKYLAARLKECDIVIFSGQFSTFLTQKIPYSIELKSTKQEAFQTSNNYLLSNQNRKIKLRLEAIDALVFQLYFGESQTSCKNSLNSQKTQVTSQHSQVGVQIDQIQQIIKFYQKKVNSFLFICHQALKLQDIHNLFLVFKQQYMFEFEKVKKIQKTVCNIVYVSSKTKFLRIDDLSLCQFVTSEFEKMKSFGQEKIKNSTQSTLKSEQFKNKNPKQATQNQNIYPIGKNISKEVFSLSELCKKQSFQSLILRMFEKKLHLQISQCLATIIEFPEKKPNKINWFLELIHERYPESRDIVEKYRTDPQEEKQQQFNKTCSQFTPIFANRSNNFSKMTALFRTDSSGDEGEFILCQEQQHAHGEMD